MLLKSSAAIVAVLCLAARAEAANLGDAVNAIVVKTYVERHCPSLKINMINFGVQMVHAGVLSLDELPSGVQDAADEKVKSFEDNADPALLCPELDRMFGPSSPATSHLILHR